MKTKVAQSKQPQGVGTKVGTKCGEEVILN